MRRLFITSPTPKVRLFSIVETVAGHPESDTTVARNLTLKDAEAAADTMNRYAETNNTGFFYKVV